MTRAITIVFIFLFVNLKSQPPWGCDQSTTAVNSTFYPGTTTNITSFTATSLLGMYLCGPNTIVYDTTLIGNLACRYAFVSASSTLITSSPSCWTADVHFIKNNGTLIINSNANSAGIKVFYEIGATIIDNTSGVQTFSCPFIVFPPADCSPTKLNQSWTNNKELKIYPNPTNGKFFFESNSIEKINITNSLGELIYFLYDPKQKQEINLSPLPNGMYFLRAEHDGADKVLKILKE